MGLLIWVSTRWFELLQTSGIIASVLFSACAMRRDEQARQISNLTAIKQDYIQIWNQVYDRPELARVLTRDVDLTKHPISTFEWLFVKLLIIHLDTVHRAMGAGLFVPLEGLKADIKGLFSAPIPRAVWDELRPLQDSQFVRFVERFTR